MVEMLHGGMLIPTSVSVCCAAAAPRADRGSALVVGLVMLLAMADYASATAAVPAVGWAVVLLVVAVATSAQSSIRQRGAALSGGAAMTAHRGLGLVLTAALLLAGPATHGMRGPALVLGHGHGGAPSLEAVLLVSTAAYVAFAVVVVGRGVHTCGVVAAGAAGAGDRGSARDGVGGGAAGALRRRMRDGTVDVAAMTTATAWMAVMVVAS